MTNAIKVLLQMQRGFLQLASTLVSIFCNHENLNFDYLFFSITMELFNKALFLS
jgi:hypothetical protein